MGEITIWINAGGQLINQDNIRAIKREGKGTRISLLKGDDIVVQTDYDKFKMMLPNSKGI